MKCEEFRKYLDEYVEGQLSGSIRRDCEAHVGNCSGCGKEYRALKAAWQALDHLPEVKPSPGFVGHFWNRVAEQESRKTPWADLLSVFSVRYQAGFAVLVLSGLIIVSAVNMQKERHGPLASVDMELIQNIELAEHFDDINELEDLRDADVIQRLDELQAEKG